MFYYPSHTLDQSIKNELSPRFHLGDTRFID